MKSFAKNLEAVFLVAAALTCVTTYASAEIPKYQARHAARIAAAAEAAEAAKDVHVVVVEGKRLSAAEKAAL